MPPFLFLFTSNAVVANAAVISLLQHLNGWKAKGNDYMLAKAQNFRDPNVVNTQLISPTKDSLDNYPGPRQASERKQRD